MLIKMDTSCSQGRNGLRNYNRQINDVSWCKVLAGNYSKLKIVAAGFVRGWKSNSFSLFLPTLCTLQNKLVLPDLLSAPGSVPRGGFVFKLGQRRGGVGVDGVVQHRPRPLRRELDRQRRRAKRRRQDRPDAPRKFRGDRRCRRRRKPGELRLETML